nr:hypothetical protein [Tanacetum cinerariifolium]
MKTEKDIKNMIIAEYVEYEARMKRQYVPPARCEDFEASVNVMPKSMFEHLKLANLKETDIEISLGIKEDRVLFDMDRGVYHSKIPVEKVYMANSIKKEESFNPLKIEDDLFSYESPACLLFEQCTRSCDKESIDPLDSVDNMQELEVKHEDMVRSPNLERIISRWHVCKLVWVFYDNECGKDCEMWPTCNPDLSFCSGYDSIYGNGKHGMLKQWMCFRDHERQSVDGNHMIFTDFLKVRYGNKTINDTTRERRYYEWVAQNSESNDNDVPHEAKIKSVRNAVLNEWVPDSFYIKADYGKTRDDPYSRRYSLDDVCEKCEKFHSDTLYLWHDEGFEEEKRWESGIEMTNFEPPFVDIKTFEIKRYSFEGGRNFVCITKHLDDALPLGRANGSRFIGMIRKEMDEEKGIIRALEQETHDLDVDNKQKEMPRLVTAQPLRRSYVVTQINEEISHHHSYGVTVTLPLPYNLPH